MKKLSIITFGLFSFIQLKSQTNEFLPLSRNGIGFINRSWSPQAQGCGHAGLAYSSEEEFNPMNPASLGFLKITDAEFGYSYKTKKISDGKIEITDNSGTLSYIQLGVPLRNSINEILERKEYKHNYAMSLGLSPLSSTSYSYIIIDSTSTGREARLLNGSGGLNQFQLGFAYRVNHLSLGINLGYVFGNLSYEQTFYLIDQSPINRDIFSDRYFGSGFKPEVGVIYEQLLKDKAESKNKQRKLGYSLLVSPGGNLRFLKNSFYRSELDLSEFGSIIDTLVYVNESKSKAQLPFKISAGISYNHRDKSGIMLDAGIENWASAKKFDGQRGDLVNQQYVGLGAWIRPDNSGYGNVFKRSQYRMGVFYDNGYLEINDEKLKNYGLTLGMGTSFNFQRQICVVNLSFEVGKTEIAKAISEKYFKVTAGIRINDNEWFLKRRYN
ncbi:MAG: hypothetical protein HOP11_12470 [Saprospiraceae bacterium]|nr:hypothetical protein [Saprospiraceae bacterium]